jgi:hypothetical protein
MAYVIVVCDDNTLRNVKKERIMQRSKLVDNLHILVPPTYKEHDMSQYTVMLEYVLPISKRYCSDILVLSDEVDKEYEEYLKYTLPFDTDLTSEAGEIELQLTFIYVNLDENSNGIQRVRKTSTTKINITPISAWSDIIPDSALNAIDQKIAMMDNRIKALDDMNALLDKTKADNLVYEDSKLQLIANGNRIGDAVVIKSNGGTGSDSGDEGSGDEGSGDEEGFPVVDFDLDSGLDSNDNSAVQF